MITSTIPSMNMKASRLTAQFLSVAIPLAFINVCPSPALAEDGHSHAQTAQKHETKLDATTDANALIKIVRDSTERFKNVAVAEAEGYALQFGCVSGDDWGAMGLHYVNGALVNSGVLDATRPQIVIYEATPTGALQLIGADYLLIADAWNKTHSGPPELNGQLFHLFDSPNRFGLPPFYTLHVWAWKQNPKGTFVNWHSQVSCTAFTEKKQ